MVYGEWSSLQPKNQRAKNLFHGLVSLYVDVKARVRNASTVGIRLE